MYAYQNGNNRCKNLPFRIKTHLNAINCSLFDTVEQPINKRNMIDQVTNSMKSIHVIRWAEIVNDRGVSGRGVNKLRKYRLFKSRSETETYSVQKDWVSNILGKKGMDHNIQGCVNTLFLNRSPETAYPTVQQPMPDRKQYFSKNDSW